MIVLVTTIGFVVEGYEVSTEDNYVLPTINNTNYFIISVSCILKENNTLTKEIINVSYLINAVGILSLQFLENTPLNE